MQSLSVLQTFCGSKLSHHCRRVVRLALAEKSQFSLYCLLGCTFARLGHGRYKPQHVTKGSEGHCSDHRNLFLGAPCSNPALRQKWIGHTICEGLKIIRKTTKCRCSVVTFHGAYPLQWVTECTGYEARFTVAGNRCIEQGTNLIVPFASVYKKKKKKHIL